jgi:hypothetical protein
MKIAIATKDRNLTSWLLDNPKILSAGKTKITIPDGDATLVFESESMAKAGIDLPRVVEFSLTFGASVVTSVVANWLWDKLKSRQVTAITIDSTSVEFEEGQIKKILIEKISMKK